MFCGLIEVVDGILLEQALENDRKHEDSRYCGRDSYRLSLSRSPSVAATTACRFLPFRIEHNLSLIPTVHSKRTAVSGCGVDIGDGFRHLVSVGTANGSFSRPGIV
jgi:hypothetical protein